MLNIKALLKQQLTDSMKPVMTFPSVSFPTKLYTPKFNDQPGEPTVMSAGSLVPVDVATKDGWLVVGNSFCSDAMPSLGVTMQQRNYQSGGASLWALQAFGITPGSPADQIGLKVGDVIDSFGVPGERAETVINGARDPFYAFIAERSKEKSPGKRTMEIGGRSVNGVPFKKTVTLCPSGMNHKDLAAKAMKEARAK